LYRPCYMIGKLIDVVDRQHIHVFARSRKTHPAELLAKLQQRTELLVLKGGL
jgi:hypothetical protein